MDHHHDAPTATSASANNDLLQAALAITSDVQHQLQLQAAAAAALAAANLAAGNIGVPPDGVDAAAATSLAPSTAPGKQKAVTGAKRKALDDKDIGQQPQQPPAKRRYTFLDPPLITRAEILVKEQQWAVAAAARHLKVSAGTLYKHFQRAQTARPASTKRKGRPQVLTPEDEARVRAWAESDSKLSYSKLAALVSSNLHKSVSPGTIGRVLKEGLPPEPEAVEKFIECMNMAKKKLDLCAGLVSIKEISDALVAAHKTREVTVRVLAESQEAWEQEPQFQPLKDAGIAVHFVRPPTTGEQDNMYCMVDKQIRVTLQQARRRRQPAPMVAIAPPSENGSVE